MGVISGLRSSCPTSIPIILLSRLIHLLTNYYYINSFEASTEKLTNVVHVLQDLHRRGHEIAVHSITHNDNENFWSNATVDDWAKEMAGMRIIVEKFANITDNSVVGLRAPYLRYVKSTNTVLYEPANITVEKDELILVLSLDWVETTNS